MTGKSKNDYTDVYTQPKLREQLKEKIKKEDKGGNAGKWSARKSQILTKEYEAEGGKYKHPGKKTKSQKNLTNWQTKNK